jgi:DNA replication initiation complex subunit (GINS family)
MYDELYKAWKQELEGSNLAKLPRDFYGRAADYVRKLGEEARMLDKRTVKASLLKKETQNVKSMVQELMCTRYRKLVEKVSRGEKILPDFLTVDEEKIIANTFSFLDTFQSLTQCVLQGRKPRIDTRQQHKRAVLRFLTNVPGIIGADMKTYGPFQAEDLASVPIDNAKILAKQNLAENVGVI